MELLHILGGNTDEHLKKHKEKYAGALTKKMNSRGSKNVEKINVVQPDVMIFCEDKNLPCAIFEVISPSTAQKDKKEKFYLYECSKIKEYFIVESEYKIVEKFKLIDAKYEFMGNFSEKEKIDIDCLDVKVEVKKFFEGIEE